MKIQRPKQLIIACLLIATTTVASIAIGQVRDKGTVTPKKDVIPKAALLTERGRQLVDQLRVLRRSEASMGPRHPGLDDVRDQIEAVKEQLQAWLPGKDGARPPAEAVPKMNAGDLQQLVLRMSAKIQQLERRVETLERRLEVF